MERYSQLVRRSLSQIRSRSQDQEDPDNHDFRAGFINFRTSHDSRPGLTNAAASYRRRTNPLFSFKVCCLRGPTEKISPILIRRLNACNLGTKKIVVSRKASIVAFRRKIRELFPLLGETDFSFKVATATSRNSLIEVNSQSLRDLKHVVKFKSLYVCPIQVIGSQEGNSADEELYNPRLEENISMQARTSSPVQTPSDIELPTIRPARPRRNTAVIANNFIRAVEQSNEDVDDVPLTSNDNDVEVTRRQPVSSRGRVRGRALGRRGSGRASATPRASQGRSYEEMDALPDPRTENSTEVVDLTREATFISAGTPSVQIRSSSPVLHGRGLLDIDTTSVICLDDTKENIQESDLNEADFIPEALPLTEDRNPLPYHDLKEVLTKHKKDFISSDVDNPLLFEVRRSNIVTDALSYMRVIQNDLNKPLLISFINEDGVDLGGLRREFWSLFVHQFAHSMFVTGKIGSLTFRPNYVERKKNTFFHLGQLVALSILEDGPGLPLFSSSVTDYILEGEIKTIDESDLSDVIKDKLKEMENVAPENLQIIYNDIFDERSDIGYLLPANKFTKQHIPSLKSAFIEHLVTSCKEELNQFIKGLDTHQILSLLKQDATRKKARGLFSGQNKPLTVVALRQILKFNYAEGNGSLPEMTTAHGFLTFIQAASSKKDSKACVNGIVVSLEDILMWMTGARTIPAAGFHKKVDIYFKDTISVNTCALCLTLKTDDTMTPEAAVKYYSELLINSQTFTTE